jgi:hypothetical protein
VGRSRVRKNDAGIKNVIKALSADREYSGANSSLQRLVHEIEAYDKKMFLFSRLKN